MEFLDALDEFLNSPIDTLSDLDIEVWRSIDRFPNYSVSNMGQVRNDKTQRILKPYTDSYGYCIVDLYENKKRKSKKAHRLVAEAFLPNPEGKRCVDHVDGCTTNNIVSNLRWATIAENIRNSKKRNNCSSPYKGVYFYQSKQKYQVQIMIDGKRKSLGYFNDPKEAAKKYNEAAIKYFKQFARLNEFK